MNPASLPPVAEKSILPPAAIVGVAGVMLTPGPIMTVAVAVSPIASVAVTTSVVLPVLPAL